MRPSAKDPIHFRFPGWRRPVGEPGDLADIILTVLSLASIGRGTFGIRWADFNRIFVQLQKEFPDLIPELSPQRIGGRVLSVRLARAIDYALRLGLEGSPRFDYEVTETHGLRNLERLRKKVGQEFLDALQPVADRLVELTPEVVEA